MFLHPLGRSSPRKQMQNKGRLEGFGQSVTQCNKASFELYIYIFFFSVHTRPFKQDKSLLFDRAWEELLDALEVRVLLERL